MRVLVTGSLGLVGLSACHHFLKKGHQVIGVDNNMRQTFFGKEGATNTNTKILEQYPEYTHYNIDIRNNKRIHDIFSKEKIDAVIHTAAQPSHDKAAEIPMLDFEVNAQATLQLLEATKTYAPNAVFIFTSTNKVYGDKPNTVPLVEKKTRYDFKQKTFRGFSENLSTDQSLHSLFGASKLAADVYVQEYGRYFGMKTAALRLGCITGAHHSGVKLHGFLSYLIKSLVHHQQYEIIGYKGKQVRDQIHAQDVVLAMEQILKNPVKGEVFNLGGGRNNSASLLELIGHISQKLSIQPTITYKEEHRVGDHLCYITDFSKFQIFYPRWKITKNLEAIIDEQIDHEKKLIKHS